jgi:ketosteroid isomerase-like protein
MMLDKHIARRIASAIMVGGVGVFVARLFTSAMPSSPEKPELSSQDVDSIHATLARYAQATDDVDSEGLASTFTQDSVLTASLNGEPIGSPVHGREAMTNHFITSRRRQGYHERHFLTNVAVRPAADKLSATVTAYFLVTKIGSEGAVVVLTTGSYTHTMRRESDGMWRIAREHISMDAPVPHMD